MSRVYFHSPTRDAELCGSERAWLRGLVDDLAVGMLALHSPNRLDRLLSLAGPDHFISQHAEQHPNGMRLEMAYRLAFISDGLYGAPLIQHRGRRIDCFELALNTAVVLGNDPMRLAARLHGQCELHAWVDGPNRAWLADIMQAGLDTGVYRRGLWRETRDSGGERTWVSQGWDDVITLLRERDDEPVVTSSSVTDQFPNSGPDGQYGDDWYELDTAEQWRIGMEWLRNAPGNLELSPDSMNCGFGHGLTVLDLFAPDWETRLDLALNPKTESDNR